MAQRLGSTEDNSLWGRKMGEDTDFFLKVAEQGGEALIHNPRQSLYVDSLEREGALVRFVDDQGRDAVRIPTTMKHVTRNLETSAIPKRGGGGGQPDQRLIRSPEDAEAVAAEWMAYWGYFHVAPAHDGPDGGVDVRSEQGVAQVKAEMRPVGRPAVQQLAGIALHEDVDGLFFSLSGFTDEASEWAGEADIALFSFDLQGTPEPLNHSAQRIAESVVPYEWRPVEELLESIFFSGAVYLDDQLPDIYYENRVYFVSASGGRTARVRVNTSWAGFVTTKRGQFNFVSVSLFLEETEDAPGVDDSAQHLTAFGASAWLARHQDETGIDPETWEEWEETRGISELRDRESRPWLFV
jgi:hypothetical protein